VYAVMAGGVCLFVAAAAVLFVPKEDSTAPVLA